MKYFPFSAIVGHEKAKLALICNAIDPTIGGVLLAGDKGSGKSTMVRAFSQILPEIEVVDNCPFNCNPHNPTEMCDDCLKKLEKGKITIAKKKMRVVDLPLSITVDRLVGTIDVTKVIKDGIKALQPGILASANRNVLYIDEVNLLEDYIADVILDAAATGWNCVERDGMSLRHPSRFILIGSMNPEEGELRPQLLDRFGMFVSVEASSDPAERMEIVKRVMNFYTDPIRFYENYCSQDKILTERIIRAQKIIKEVEIPENILNFLIDEIIKLGIKTHRAEITTVKASRAIAALEERKIVTVEDVKQAMELTLPHRLKSNPFKNAKNFHQIFQDIIDKIQYTKQETIGNLQKTFESADIEKISRSISNKREKNILPKSSRDAKTTIIGKPIGIPVSYTIPSSSYMDSLDINFFATLIAAINSGSRNPLKITKDNIRINIRKCRASNLNVILLDSSGSMTLQKRIEIAKGIAKNIAETSYTRRNLISLIVFSNSEAKIALHPTKKYEEIFDIIESIPTGGRTPLPSALLKLLSIARNLKRRKINVHGILITDGKANVPLFRSIEDDILNLCLLLNKEKVKLEIYYTTSNAFEYPLTYIPTISEITKSPIHYIKV